jgi:hypothetical protein
MILEISNVEIESMFSKKLVNLYKQNLDKIVLISTT